MLANSVEVSTSLAEKLIRNRKQLKLRERTNPAPAAKLEVLRILASATGLKPWAANKGVLHLDLPHSNKNRLRLK